MTMGYASLVRYKIAEEQAEATLKAIAHPVALADLIAEADRRAEVYAEAWRVRPDAPPAYTTPRCAGLRSVAEDVAKRLLG